MEWLGLVLLYLISGYMKKRQQVEKRKQIEDDPDWDSESNFDNKLETNNIENFLNDLFESNPKIPQPSSSVKDVIKDEEIFKNEQENIKDIEKIEDISKNEDLNEIQDQIEQFEENIYSSTLSEKKEMHLGNKWLKKKNIRKQLFPSKNSLKKSIIVKEILEKPLSIRK